MYYYRLLQAQGYYTIEEKYNLRNIFNADEEDDFLSLHQKSENEMTEEEFNRLEKYYDKLKKAKPLAKKYLNHETNDYDWYPGEDCISWSE